MNGRIVTALSLSLLVGCGCRNLSPQDLESRTDELVTDRLLRFTNELQALRQEGLGAAEAISINFSFHASKKACAAELKQAIEQSTPYTASIHWFKEPEEGWFVVGQIPDLNATREPDRALLVRLTKLGLEHGCEIRWWKPERSGRSGAV